VPLVLVAVVEPTVTASLLETERTAVTVEQLRLVASLLLRVDKVASPVLRVYLA
jgi:hypothetical protein